MIAPSCSTCGTPMRRVGYAADRAPLYAGCSVCALPWQGHPVDEVPHVLEREVPPPSVEGRAR